MRTTLIKLTLVISTVCLGLYVVYAAKGPPVKHNGDICSYRGGCVWDPQMGCWVDGNCEFRRCYGIECPGFQGDCTPSLVMGDWEKGRCAGCSYTWVCVPKEEE